MEESNLKYFHICTTSSFFCLKWYKKIGLPQRKQEAIFKPVKGQKKSRGISLGSLRLLL